MPGALAPRGMRRQESEVCVTKTKEVRVVERGEFRGKPVLILKRSEDERYPFSFGLSKAKLILEHIEDIKKFVEDNNKPSA